MIDHTTIRKSAVALASIGALGLGGSAIAGAAGTDTSSSSRPAGEQREALSAENAAKVRAAALEEVPGATVVRTESGGPYSTPYHAHVRTDDGTLRVVLVDAAFEATGVQAERARGTGERPAPR
jgi:hypothetical protein